MDGIVGIYGPGDPELVSKTFLATGACQHRGKASTGLAVGNSRGIYIYKGLGRIAEVIDRDIIRTFEHLSPMAAIGNIGYTKQRIPEKINVEPIEIRTKGESSLRMVLTMDGYLIIKEEEIKAELETGYRFQTHNKTEVVGALLHQYMTEEGISFAAGEKLVDRLSGRGTFALTALVYDGKETHLVALNDDKAFEPFCYAAIDGAFAACSESCSHRRLGGATEKEYDGAEMTLCSSKGIETKRLRNRLMMPDVFQGVYFGNVASVFRGKEIFQLRRELGLGLTAQYSESRADVVIPNPESGWGVTVGVSEGLKKTAAAGFNQTASSGSHLSGRGSKKPGRRKWA